MSDSLGRRKPTLEVYCPFGMAIKPLDKEGQPDYRFQFMDIEKEKEFGIDWAMTEFRPYDGQLGRFHQVDNLAEQFANWSPFHYSYNNPIAFNDPTGLAAYRYNWDTKRYEDENENEVSWEDVNSNNDYSSDITDLMIGIHHIANFLYDLGYTGGGTRSNDYNHPIEFGAAIVKKDGKIYATNITTDGELGDDGKWRPGPHPDDPDLKTAGVGYVTPNIDLDDGETLIAYLHTHPYHRGLWPGRTNVPHSASDISSMRDFTHIEGYMEIVESGTKRYVIKIEDAYKASRFFYWRKKNAIELLHLQGRGNGCGTSFGEKGVEGVLNVVGKSEETGLGFYMSVGESKTSFIKLN